MQILKTIADKLQSFAKPPRDPSEFNDPIATRTEWTAFNKANSNFNLNRLVVDPDGHHLFYKPTTGMYLFCAAFIFMGLLFLVIIVGSAIQNGKPIDKDVILPGLFSLLFSFIGLGIFIALRKQRRFDMTERCMIIGDNRTYFSDVHALQLVLQRGSKHSNYQINLVLRDDADRIYIMNYADSHTARQDAARIAQAIGLPAQKIWDIMPGYADAQNHPHTIGDAR